ncbi:Uncharacterized protein involved in exopolysaccharide biosynthesis [Dethiosulfatibacter aminovorans DSM 17477]|uniref:Uncharacterized protein involved in exopolysaccharide biosynthesis n=1 Tax=Dethiosulfatibacter aminovorans DSM 17477 TaxID=1121476 RepID=A0A1M6LMT9_9FIRM|nr:Wzz/FepE/Etk N-terminal domain-containing protein [Dethiosulfatibacter aminovorans]SHJ72541.1 Uncharacterized protein involved in exopolysaccharide biosynthesis [Dethiosulfatibacter aminovorans DSM 17477]
MGEEISLRELIETLFKNWKMITIITTAFMFVAAIMGYIIMDPVYEAETVLMASYATEKISSVNANTDDLEGILDSISVYPNMTLQTYKEQLNSPAVLQETIDELGLSKENINVARLIKMVSLETISNTNLIAIKVASDNPKLSSEIANTLADKFTDFITDMSKERASNSSKFLEKQLEAEKTKLDDALLGLKQFLSQPRGVDELKGEVNSVLSMLTNYKTQVVQKNVELSKVIAGIYATEEEISKTPKIITVRKTLDSDSLLNQVVSELNDISIIDTSEIVMESEEINKNYLSLTINASNLKIQKAELEKEIEQLSLKISDYQMELENIQQELAGKNYEKTLIDNKISIAQETYDAFLKKYEESLIAESTKIGESSIYIVSYAIVPEYPIGPRKLLNTAIGGILGLMLGVCIAFFRAYWKATSKPQQ